ncbi:MAG: hypothetical protein JWR19_2679 [Pedosphaera sp.]|nr:hypothetical protein [Pedosphaera sp.]
MRTEFAANLADDIRTWSGDDSLVIAIYGSWGSGKSSLKNLICESLEKSGKNVIPTLEFNPWQLSGTGNIPSAFFRDLQITLRGSGPKQDIEKRSKVLKAYSTTLDLTGTAFSLTGKVLPFVAVPGGPIVEAIGKGIKSAGSAIKKGSEALNAKSEAEQKSSQELKCEVAKMLERMPQPILVIIDDIDRLTTDEILQVFQLVKANADFPHLIYLLLFERDIVTNALGRISGDHGVEFLEKIIQVAYHIPHAPIQAVQKVLFHGLDSHIDEPAIAKRWDKHRWSELFADGVASYFQNLRHVYRFLASFSFHVRHHKKERSFEVNPVDLIGLETLRVFEPAVYERLSSAKSFLTRSSGMPFSVPISQAVMDEAISQIAAHASTGKEATVKSILKLLFPPITSEFENNRSIGHHLHTWLRELRVCHGDLFDKYFTLSIPNYDISQAELDHLLELAADVSGFVKACEALKQRGLLKTAFDRLEAYKEHIPLNSMPSLISALCNLSDGLPKRVPGLLEQDIGMYFSRLVYFGLRRQLNKKERFEVLKNALENSSGLALAIDLVSNEERVNDRVSRGHEFLIGEADLEELKLICTKKLRKACQTTLFRSSPRLKVYLWRWRSWTSDKEVREWVALHSSTTQGAIWLLTKLLNESHSYGREHTIGYSIQLAEVEQFADVKTLNSFIIDVDESCLCEDERIAVREFRKALKRRAEGKPDDIAQQELDDADINE